MSGAGECWVVRAVLYWSATLGVRAARGFGAAAFLPGVIDGWSAPEVLLLSGLLPWAHFPLVDVLAVPIGVPGLLRDGESLPRVRGLLLLLLHDIMGVGCGLVRPFLVFFLFFFPVDFTLAVSLRPFSLTFSCRILGTPEISAKRWTRLRTRATVHCRVTSTSHPLPAGLPFV